MPKKKTEEELVEAVPESDVELAAVEPETPVEAAAEPAEEVAIVEPVTPVEAAAEAAEEVALVETEALVEIKAEKIAAVPVVATEAEQSDVTDKSSRGNRAQRVGLVTSDKMTNTVVVRVDRLVKHPRYRRYVRQRKKYMAHDEMGAGIGDKVKIVETRPLSARKRWRVIEIVQKAAR